MIFDMIEKSSKYDFLSEKFKYAFDLMRSFDPAHFEKGKTPHENGVWFNQFEYESKPFETSKMEAHQKYADVMFMAAGEEYLLYKPAKELTDEVMAYDETQDVALYTANEDAVKLPIKQGLFAVFFPEDGHGSGVMKDAPATVRRIVIKVPLD